MKLPEKGRAIDADDMNAAMAVLKANNINAVRTCHYPDQSLWYDLCDKNGIYMIDETNLESHGSWQKLGAIEPSWNVPGSLPEWKDCVVDRARSMLERDKRPRCCADLVLRQRKLCGRGYSGHDAVFPRQGPQPSGAL